MLSRICLYTYAQELLSADLWQDVYKRQAVISCKDSLDPRKKTIIRAESATIGKVIDAGIKDANQMGAAMVPAAVDTLLNHLEDTKRSIEYYDLVATGDLGFIGKDIMMDLLGDAGLPKKEVFEHYDDCGTMLFTKEQDVHAGGSAVSYTHLAEPLRSDGSHDSAGKICGDIILGGKNRRRKAYRQVGGQAHEIRV